MSETVVHAPGPNKVTGRKVLLWLIGAFVLVGGVNGLMVYFAISTFAGQTDSHPYAQGLNFNKSLQAITAQRALDWRVDGTITDAGHGIVSLRLAFHDREGRTLQDLAITAHLSRPTNEGQDFDAALSHQGNGLYTAEVRMPASGQWLVRVSAAHDGMAPYLLDYRVFVK